MIMNKKELALELIKDLIALAKYEDEELNSLKKLCGLEYKNYGESALVFHLKSLKELVEQL